MTSYYIKQKISLLANRYEIFEQNPEGESGGLIAFAQQKRFTLREKFTFYRDETKNEIVFEVEARQVMDFAARYEVKDKQGTVLAVIGKAFKSSLLRSTWQIFSSDESKPTLIARERSLPLAIGRRLWELLPYISEIPFFVKYHFDFIRPDSDKVLASYEKTALLRDYYRLDIHNNEILDEYGWRTLVALAVMMDAMQSR